MSPGIKGRRSLPMMFRGSFLLSVLTLFQGHLFCNLDPAHAHAVMSIVKKYQRPYTLLEIGKGSSIYIMKLPHLKRMVGAAVFLEGDIDSLVAQIQKKYPRAVSLMAPPKLTSTMLDTLGRCEHFDVVIVHDISSWVKVPYQRLIALLTELGDHVFMCAESEAYERVLKKSSRIRCVVDRSLERPALFLSARKKKGLDLARYTQVKSRSSQPRYEVMSTYRHKEFTKGGLHYPLTWIQGINLVTFCMLFGVYPNDEGLSKQFLGFRKSLGEHTDLVLGNFILQGTRLYPIDSSDSRRNADPYDLLNAALRAFKRGNTRLQDPKGWIDKYYADIKSGGHLF